MTETKTKRYLAGWILLLAGILMSYVGWFQSHENISKIVGFLLAGAGFFSFFNESFGNAMDLWLNNLSGKESTSQNQKNAKSSNQIHAKEGARVNITQNISYNKKNIKNKK